METYRLGKTDLWASRLCFGALPIQRIAGREATRLLHAALEAGINLYDTASGYTDSEAKLGEAFEGKRRRVIFATKVSGAKTGEQAASILHNSLRELRTDYVDILQFHNAAFVPRPGGEDGLYDALTKARHEGKLRYIGLTSHRPEIAAEAACSGLYDVIQFPFSYLSTEAEQAVVAACRERNVGFLAMKALAGGLLNDGAAVFHFMSLHKAYVRPLLGIQRMEELEEFIGYLHAPPSAEKAQAVIARDQKELAGNFCRGCGYCLPCPAGIPLSMVVRMYYLLRRTPMEMYVNDEWYGQMQKIKGCIHCGQCDSRCPYGLGPQGQLQAQYEDYMAQYRAYREMER